MTRKSEGGPLDLPPPPPVLSAYATMPPGHRKYGSTIALLATSQSPTQCLLKAVHQYEAHTGLTVASARVLASKSAGTVRYTLFDPDGAVLTRLYIVGRP